MPQRWGPTWEGNSTSHVGAGLNSNERWSQTSRKLILQTCPCPRHVSPPPTPHTVAWSPHETFRFPNGLQDPAWSGPCLLPSLILEGLPCMQLLAYPRLFLLSWTLMWHLSSGLPLWISWWRSHWQCMRPGFNLWVGKIPWRRDQQPTPVFWPGEFHGLCPWGCKESDTTEQLSLSLSLCLECPILVPSHLPLSPGGP